MVTSCLYKRKSQLIHVCYLITSFVCYIFPHSVNIMYFFCKTSRQSMRLLTHSQWMPTEELQLLMYVCMCTHEHHFKVFPYKPRHH